ncbi:DUF4400 domain-containing protein [Polaromonas naphthalenivorans]|uniref:DUF4400 domain-containing protein n=1 Tax=Polaromonas naphthalenivorans (strain CJ2) TaxID=365044 RepID=A1VVD6_POLNA|nr:DUF4400 domain-containing protein [Polaromonas naphthalenivorans]ABM39614.1 hypothetical protein Pnap_4332 [Polaromonas naphthalenivorans CJ2]
MIEIKNQFANHLIFWSFALPLVGVLGLPALLPSGDFVISDAEVTFFKNVLAKDTGAITASCDALFNSLFVKTHIAPAFKEFFAPALSAGENPLGSMANKFSSDYNNALWLMVYRGIWRLTGLWTIVLSVLMSLGIPFLIDGLAVRARKSYNFQFHNPVVFWTASHSMILVVGLGIFLPFLPYALNPGLLLGFCVMFCASLWITAANFQTGN